MTTSAMNIVDVTQDWKADLWDWPLQRKDDVVHVRNLPDRWEVGLDAGHFAPEEIEVMMADSNLFIFLHHDERTDAHGTVSREVKRSYRLPDDVDPSSVRSHLTVNGVLRITAQKKKAAAIR